MSSPEKLIIKNLDVWTSSGKTSKKEGRGKNKKQEFKGIKKLRELILEITIRGFLEPQVPSDEPASELLEMIQAEKSNLVKNGKIRKTQIPSFRKNEEKPFNLPSGWEWAPLGIIGNIFNGNSISKQIKKEKYTNIAGYPFLATKDVGYGFEPLDYNNGISIPIDEPKFKIAGKGSVLICAEGGSAGKKCGITDRKICFGNKLFANELHCNIEPNFILSFYLTPTFYRQFRKLMKGIIGGISASNFAQIQCPIPPLKEQKRIVAKVNELMSICDRLESEQENSRKSQETLVSTLLNLLIRSAENNLHFGEAWRTIQTNFDKLFTTEKSIDQLKQTIVKLSIMGKLTFQDPKDEHPSELIKLSTKEIANFSKVDELNKQISQSSIKKEAQIYPLPKGWISARFGDIFTLKYGNNLPSEKRSETGEFPVYGSNGIVGTHNESCVDKPCIIVGRKGSAGALNLCLKNGCWVTDVAYSLVPPSSVNLEYVFLCLQSLDLNSLSKGIKPGLNRKEVYDLIISIPPLKEQQRIVIKVDQIMKLCERLKKNIISADTKKINFVDSVMEKICS